MLLTRFPHLQSINRCVRVDIETECRYAAYLRKQEMEIKALRKEERSLLPVDIDYMAMDSLSIEEKEKLTLHRPRDLAAASRIEGVTPSSL